MVISKFVAKVALGATIGVLLFVSGWAVAKNFESPSQRAAAARPPQALPVFAPVTQGDLTDQVSGSGTLQFETQTQLTPVGLAANSVVTSAPMKAGETVRNGSVISEVNGAPVFIFAGRFPFFRDLARGVVGPDVRQLQTDLRDAGYFVDRSEDGTFGPSTEGAVRRLAQSSGYSASAPLSLAQLLVVPTLPGYVASVLPVGSRVTDATPLAVIGSGQVIARISIDVAAAARLRIGMSASITQGSTVVNAKVSDVRASTGESSTSQSVQSANGASGPSQGSEFTVVLRPIDRIDTHEIGSPIVGSITIQMLAHRTLLVPTRAVATDATGASKVLVRVDKANARPVSVSILGSLGGLTAVAPTEGGSLSIKDEVEVGR